MSSSKKIEVESLKKQFSFLTNLINRHQQSQEVSYRKSRFNTLPYRHPNSNTSTKYTRPDRSFNSYKYSCNSNSSVPPNLVTNTYKNASYENHLQRPQQFLTKSNFSSQNTHSKFSKLSDLSQSTKCSSFKIVKAPNIAKNKLYNPLKCSTVTDSIKKDCSQTLSESNILQNTITKGEPKVSSLLKLQNTSNKVEKGVGNPLESAVASSSSKKNLALPCNGKNNVTNSKLAKGVAKVSYVSCSDCVIEISEYANGEMQISQKKVEHCPVNNTHMPICSGDEKSMELPSQKLTQMIVDNPHNSKHNLESLKPVKDSQCETFVGENVVQSKCIVKVGSNSLFMTDNKETNIFELENSVNFASSSKNNVPSKTANKIVNKYGVHRRRSLSVNFSENKLKSPMPFPRNGKYKKVNPIFVKTRSSGVQIVKNKHSIKKINAFKCKASITKKNCPTLKYKYFAKSRQNAVQSTLADASHVHNFRKTKNSPPKNVYQVANRIGSYSRRAVKSHFNSNSLSRKLNNQIGGKPRVKTGMIGSKMITRHTLRIIPQKRVLFQKSNCSASTRSLLGVHSSAKKHKRIRFRKTAYKVVNKHDSHISQVVQMIKTKYTTVNQRSESNSHLKYLCAQKKKMLVLNKRRKLQNHCSKDRWPYPAASLQNFGKPFTSHNKPSRKHSVGQNKVLKKIGGVAYKVSNTKINKSVTPKGLKKRGLLPYKDRSSITINVRGNRYKMAPGGKSLTRLGSLTKRKNNVAVKCLKVGGITYVQQKEDTNLLIRSSSQTQNVASRMLHRSIHTARAAATKKTLQKNNMFCMFFNRFGHCNKGGDCPYTHDPSKIAVCTRFLRGTCKNEKCPFSHEVSPGKMALCSYFLQGSCTNSKCPYQHTNIEPGAKMCKAFAKGYCKNGSECQNAHVLACPQFICEGFCDKGPSCQWPHPRMKKNVKEIIAIPETVKQDQSNDAPATDFRYFTCEMASVLHSSEKEISGEKTTHVVRTFIKNGKQKEPLLEQPHYIPLCLNDDKF